MSKTIRNPEAYNAARQEDNACREKRIKQIIDRIEYTVRRESDFYGKPEDVAWQLRRRGVLGKCDRKKDRSDQYGQDIADALERAQHDPQCPIVVRNGVTGIIVSHASRPPAVVQVKTMGRASSKLPMKFVRKYEKVVYPKYLFDHLEDEIDELCDPRDPRYRHIKGVLPRELIDH